MNTPTTQTVLESFGIYKEKRDKDNLYGANSHFLAHSMGMFDLPRTHTTFPTDNATSSRLRIPDSSITKHRWKDMLHVYDYFNSYNWEFFDSFDSQYSDHREAGKVEDDVTQLKNKQDGGGREKRLSAIVTEAITTDHLFMDIGLFDWHSHPQTYRLMKTIELITGHVVFQYKDRYKRPRPTFDHPELTAIIDVPSHPSWPSGHATQSHAIATILSLVVHPHSEKRRNRFESTAKTIAENREWAGLHYASDSAAGVQLANNLMSDVGIQFDQKNDTRLNQLINAAIAEWK